MTDADYDALCIHGPGSPDRCGHPDCIGWRLYKPVPREVPTTSREGE